MLNYPNLRAPLKIGTMEIPNRIGMGPMGDGLSTDDGNVTEEMIRYYELRAKNNVGFMIIGTTSVERHEGTKPGQHSIYREEHLRGLRRLAEGMHRYGAATIVQICHAGKQGNAVAMGHKPYGPMTVEGPNGPTAIGLTVEQIHEIEQNFINAAVWLQRAGFDGVEVHAGHGYLIHQFLSCETNQRTDEYGGSFENRTRMLKNILLGIREKCGRFPVSVRLSCEDGQTNGLHIEESLEIAKCCEEWGAAMLSASAGMGATQYMMIAKADYPEGHLVQYSEALKKVVSIPVAVAGRLRHFDYCDKIIEEGKADIVLFSRPLLADPAFARKQFEGREDEVRHCLACGYCSDTTKNGGVRCAVNPTMALELWYDQPAVNGNGRPVAVIGGGPGGCEAARVFAMRGFKVTLFEATDTLGGETLLAAAPPAKDDVYNLRDYYTTILNKLGVDIRYNTMASIDDVHAVEPYAVVLATGSSPIIVKVPGSDLPNVTTPHAVMGGEYEEMKDSTVTVVGMGATGVDAAAWLQARGNKVIMADMAANPEAKMSRTIGREFAAVKKDGAEVYTGHQLLEITPDSIKFERVADGETVEIKTDYVLMSIGERPNNQMWEQLRSEYGFNAAKVGHVADPMSQIHEAVFEAFNFAWNLDAPNYEL